MACTCLGEIHGSSRCSETDDPKRRVYIGRRCQYQEGPGPRDAAATVMSQQLSTPFPDDPGMETLYL